MIKALTQHTYVSSASRTNGGVMQHCYAFTWTYAGGISRYLRRVPPQQLEICARLATLNLLCANHIFHCGPAALLLTLSPTATSSSLCLGLRAAPVPYCACGHRSSCFLRVVVVDEDRRSTSRASSSSTSMCFIISVARSYSQDLARKCAQDELLPADEGLLVVPSRTRLPT